MVERFFQINKEIQQSLDEMGAKTIDDYPLAGSFTNRYLPIMEKARRFQFAELFAAAVGTLVWGFGDLVVSKFVTS